MGFQNPYSDPEDDRDSSGERQDSPPSLPDLLEPPPSVGPRFHPLVRVLLYLLAVWLGLQIVVGLPAGVLWFLISGTSLNGQETVQSDGAMLLFINVFLAPATLLITIPFVRRLDRRKLTDIGFRWPVGGGRSAVAMAVLGIVIVAAFLGLWLAIVLIKASPTWGGWSEVFRSGPSYWPGTVGSLVTTVLIIAGFLIQGGTEELVFRGYIYRNLKDRWSWANAAAGSSFLFALVHGFNPNVTATSLVNTFLLGLIFALIIERMGSLWLPALLHGLWNFFLASVLSLPVSGIEIFHILDLELTGPTAWTGGGYGPEGSLVLTFMLLPVAFILAYRIDRSRRSPSA